MKQSKLKPHNWFYWFKTKHMIILDDEFSPKHGVIGDQAVAALIIRLNIIHTVDN